VIFFVKDTETEKLLRKDTVSLNLVLSKKSDENRDEITENNNITAEELVVKLGINLQNIKLNIAKLKSRGLIERIGPR
jgi:predicted HTH transcriptional regulator